MKIFGTGLSGLVGSRVVEILRSRYIFETSEVDIVEKEEVSESISSSDAPIVLHLAAKTNVDECEKDREIDQKIIQGGTLQYPHTAYAVNVIGTKNIAQVCRNTGKKLIYISTDFVFDGEKPAGEYYTESDKPNPVNWYATTKYEGEKIVQKLPYFLIVRIAYPYGGKPGRKKDFVRSIVDKLVAGQKIFAVMDHIFTPTFIDDIGEALDILIKNNAEGIYHIVGSEFLTPYEAALLIAKRFGFSESLIQKISREEFFKNRAKRPFNLALSNQKAKELGIKLKGFSEGLELLQI
jgi:dTDP-4-dehydrorhamnose reductase